MLSISSGVNSGSLFQREGDSFIEMFLYDTGSKNYMGFKFSAPAARIFAFNIIFKPSCFTVIQGGLQPGFFHE